MKNLWGIEKHEVKTMYRLLRKYKKTVKKQIKKHPDSEGFLDVENALNFLIRHIKEDNYGR